MQVLKNRRILIGLTGGVAIYKSLDLLRLLKKAGASLEVVMTESAKQFVTPLMVQSLTGNVVRDQLFDLQAEAAMGHIELAKSCDAILIAPASANTIAKLNHGFADDLLTTLCLATRAPVLVAPAMNQAMWHHKAVQENIRGLIDKDYQVIEPAAGEQACGDVGLGRLPEPSVLFAYLEKAVAPKILHGKTILVTAGPTEEAVDPVRYLANASSGKMGYAVAHAAACLGANVTLISGPVHETPSPLVKKIISVKTASEMASEVSEYSLENEILVAAAAVADVRPSEQSATKIKKSALGDSIVLTKNPDVIAAYKTQNPKGTVIGFAAETDDLEAHAKQKLIQKNMAAICANWVGDDQAFGKTDNALTVFFSADIKPVELPLAPKQTLAFSLWKIISEKLFSDGLDKEKTSYPPGVGENRKKAKHASRDSSASPRKAWPAPSTRDGLWQSADKQLEGELSLEMKAMEGNLLDAMKVIQE